MNYNILLQDGYDKFIEIEDLSGFFVGRLLIMALFVSKVVSIIIQDNPQLALLLGK